MYIHLVARSTSSFPRRCAAAVRHAKDEEEEEEDESLSSLAAKQKKELYSDPQSPRGVRDHAAAKIKADTMQSQRRVFQLIFSRGEVYIYRGLPEFRCFV